MNVIYEHCPGGPAFPILHPAGAVNVGMSILDYFAGQALSGFIVRGGCEPALEKDRAQRSYAIAAAMLAERERRMKEK